jgi:hypothetical protein
MFFTCKWRITTLDGPIVKNLIENAARLEGHLYVGPVEASERKDHTCLVVASFPNQTFLESFIDCCARHIGMESWTSTPNQDPNFGDLFFDLHYPQTTANFFQMTKDFGQPNRHSWGQT